jgi:hypothetical protein
VRVAIAALVAVAVLALLVAFGWLGQDETPPGALVLLPGATELAELDAADKRELAREFRPYLFFDSREKWRPLEVGRFLSEVYADGNGHEVCPTSDRGSCRQIRTIDELVATVALRDPKQALRLNIHGRLSAGRDFESPTRTACFEAKLRDCDSGPATVIYANLHPAGDQLFIDYWWFLRYNDLPLADVGRCGILLHAFPKLCGDHEGDWEGITVVTDLPPTQVQYAIFAQHDGRLRLDPGPRGDFAARRFEFADSARRHIKVYVAQGTHASYPSPCARRRGRVLCKQGNGLPEGFHDGERPWGRNDEGECGEEPGCVLLLPRVGTEHDGEPLLYASSWNAWPGLWGFCAKGEARCGKGPESPGLQPRYQRPSNRLTPSLEVPDAAVPLPAPAPAP